VELAEKFNATKAARGFVEYADQVALALQIVRRGPQVAHGFREKYKVVLLDEYQDTSVVQTWLLSEMFGGHPVMAVGDPNQSIYGWRGASAANLEDFATQFSDTAFGDGTVQNFALSTSWRNGHHVLAAANTLIEPLIAGARVHVEKLGAGPKASSRPVEVVVEETLVDEADAVARWLKARLNSVPGEEKPSAAIL